LQEVEASVTKTISILANKPSSNSYLLLY